MRLDTCAQCAVNRCTLVLKNKFNIGDTKESLQNLGITVSEYDTFRYLVELPIHLDFTEKTQGLETVTQIFDVITKEVLIKQTIHRWIRLLDRIEFP